MRRVVVLPAPSGPTRPKSSPRATAKVEAVHGDEGAEAPGQAMRRGRRPPAALSFTGAELEAHVGRHAGLQLVARGRRSMRTLTA